MDQDADHLSSAQKQYLQACRLLLTAPPEILLLDEVTSTLPDAESLVVLRTILENFKNSTVLCSMHQVHLAQGLDFDRELDFYNGRLVSDKKPAPL